MSSTAKLHVRLHVQPLQIGHRGWRVGLEKKSAEALGLFESEDSYPRYGKGTVQLEVAKTQANAIKVGVYWQHSFWDEHSATSSLYVHDRNNKILEGDKGERTYPRSHDQNPPAGVKRRK